MSILVMISKQNNKSQNWKAELQQIEVFLQNKGNNQQNENVTYKVKEDIFKLYM